MYIDWHWIWRKLVRHRPQAISAHAIRDYRRLVRRKLAEHPGNRPLALAQAIGTPTLEEFHATGDGHVAVLRHHGIADGMAVYDLGCGCGRTAQALVRDGWQGGYTGADIIPELVEELERACPGYRAIVHRELSIAAPDASQDMVFHWSVFTHLYPEECYIYLLDIFRTLKPGGRLVFSFLELDGLHDRLFDGNVKHIQRGWRQVHLNQFLHRDWIAFFARRIGFAPPRFTAGDDATHHPAFWQSLAVLDKPPG